MCKYQKVGKNVDTKHTYRMKNTMNTSFAIFPLIGIKILFYVST